MVAMLYNQPGFCYSNKTSQIEALEKKQTSAAESLEKLLVSIFFAA